MGNETEKNQQNPGQGNRTIRELIDPNKKNPSQTGQDVNNPQDTTRRIPGRTAARPTARIAKDPRTSKSAAHPNQDRD